VADAPEDTENVRRLFVNLVGQPNATFVVGASMGGLVTASVVERFGASDGGTLNYNGALSLCGPVAGGRRNFYGLFDLRTIYQYYCQNLPRPSEAQYDLFLGLAPGQVLPMDDFNARINECTGIELSPEARTPQQRANLSNILNAAKISEGFLPINLGYAAYGLQELVQIRLNGHSPVTNLGVVYTGTTDDAALNAGVYRAGSDQIGRDYMVSAYDPTGQVQIPTLTMHRISDDLVIVENERAYRETLEAAGTADNLVQTYIDGSGHCGFTAAEFQAAFHSLLRWVETGSRPTPAQVARLCQDYSQLGSCNFNLKYQPQRFESRIAPRDP
jgi:pimeloyl-ACP methyl ester carboxylesterase